MANFLVVVDPDRVRCERFLQSCVDLAPVEGLLPGRLQRDAFGARWAANPRAPLSRLADEDGAGLLFGEAFLPDARRPLDACGFRALRQAPSPDGRERALDGFFASILWDARAGLRVEADLLGCFPVYYADLGEAILVGASPETFPRHPLFRSALDPVGLAAVLLSSSLFEGRTPWRDVRRLAAGHRLEWRPGAGAREVRVYHHPEPSRETPERDLDAHLQRTEAALLQAISRMAGSQGCDMVLSGGTDSRILAGLSARLGVTSRALTLGLPSDLEVCCARPVAKALGFEHRVVEPPALRRVDHARATARWEHLAGGMNELFGWEVVAPLQEMAPRFLTGLCLDGVLEGLKGGIDEATSPFETSLAGYVYRRGLPVSALRTLAQPELAGAIDDAQELIRGAWERTSDDPFARSFLFNILHRHRFQIGRILWRASFGSWPVAPALDQAVQAAGAALPPAQLDSGWVRYQLVRERLPQLARLPLDRNAYRTDALDERYPLLRRAQSLGRRFQGKLGVERRCLYRNFDLNGPGWRAVRRAVEPHRRAADPLLRPAALDAFLPGPDVPLRFAEEAITAASGHRTLMALLLWADGRI